jgi:hypothetical protein
MRGQTPRRSECLAIRADESAERDQPRAAAYRGPAPSWHDVARKAGKGETI